MAFGNDKKSPYIVMFRECSGVYSSPMFRGVFWHSATDVSVKFIGLIFQNQTVQPASQLKIEY